MNPYSNRPKIKKILLIVGIVFLLWNGWMYSIAYKQYVVTAPSHLKEARKDFVNAYMVQLYYVFFVKVGKINPQNSTLYPFRTARDYFYYKGLSKLAKDDAERALWFNLFEANMYNFFVRAKYGSMVKHYGYEYSKKFIDKVYENIKILSVYKVSDFKNFELSSDIVETYLDLISIYIYDFHLNPKGYLFSERNIKKVSLDSELHKKFVNIYHWQRDFLEYYKKNNTREYARVLSKYQAWNSPYQYYYDKLLKMSSFILFYKIKNNLFSCVDDKKYLDDIEKSKTILLNFAEKKNIPLKRRKNLERQISYLSIINEYENNRTTVLSTNPLKSTIHCNYMNEKEIRQ